MKKIYSIFTFCLLGFSMLAQDIHFSQFYNAPMLVNPANTGLLENNDWRIGMQFRNQGATIPIPYNTLSVFADACLMRNKWENSWIGTGLSVWRDVAGNGDLALTRMQGNIAAHVLSDKTSFSVGLNGTYNQRSVDFSKLTYDVQWDEFSFDKDVPNQETFNAQKTKYFDLGAGAIFSYFNNNNLQIKTSVGMQHINRPLETFYGMSNKIGLRPTASLEVTFKATDKIIFTPSVYFSTQKKATNLVAGTLFNVNTSGDVSLKANELIVGCFYRNTDAVIGVAGYQFGASKVMFSYDHTVSELAQGNNGIGAFEVSLILQGNYKKGDERTKKLGCPRF